MLDLGDPLQMNPYIYGNNNPLTFSDADGLWPKIKMPKVVKSAVNKVKETVKEVAPVAHIALDVAGMVPVIGEAADLVNAGLYAAEGDWTNAALSAAGAIPIAGNAVTAAKTANKAVDAGQAIAKNADTAGDLSKAAPPVKAGPKDGPNGGVDNTVRNETRTSCNSFAPDTRVLMGDGTTKPIVEIRVGDEVLAADPESGEQGAREVVATVGGDRLKGVVEITVIGAEAPSSTTLRRTLIATEGHPFWVPEMGAWVPAGELEPGQLLLDVEDSPVEVIDVREAGERADVRNLTVEDLHTYFVVAGDASLLVHNVNQPLNGVCGPNNEPIYPIPYGSAGGNGAGQIIRDSDRVDYNVGVRGTNALPRPMCSWCRVNPAQAVDHVRARNRQGDLTDQNLTPACRACNSSKRDWPTPLNAPRNYPATLAWPPPHWGFLLLLSWRLRFTGMLRFFR